MENVNLVVEHRKRYPDNKIEVCLYQNDMMTYVKLSEFAGETIEEKLKSISMAGEIAFFFFPDGRKIFI